ncbi:MAG: plasmid pRiA4b ORF-3 family protein [Cyanobacteria bacterium P01_C01_bin.120]
MAKPQRLQCHVWLMDSEPPIWRSFEVSDQITLDELHAVLQVVMGWEFSHLYAFDIGRDRYASPFPVPLDDTFNSTTVQLATFNFESGKKFGYTYDFGDGWVHQVTVAEMQPLVTPDDLPRCLEGDRACPPEDCGGIWGYEELLERLSDPDEPEFEELLDWLGDFDPAAFDVTSVNRRLAETFQ